MSITLEVRRTEVLRKLDIIRDRIEAIRDLRILDDEIQCLRQDLLIIAARLEWANEEELVELMELSVRKAAEMLHCYEQKGQPREVLHAPLPF